MPKSKTVLTLALLITASFVGVVAGSFWIGFLLSKSKSVFTSVENPVPANTTINSSSLNQVELTTARNVDYSHLQEYLQRQD